MRIRMIVAAVVAAMLVPAAAAMSHAPEQFIVYYQVPNTGVTGPCAKGLARIAHGNYDKGFARANTYSLSLDYVFGNPCAVPNGKPAGQIRAHFAYDVKRPNGYAYCDNSPWVNNPGGGYFVEVYRNYGNRPCGQAWYRVIGAHAVYIKGNWRNGLTNSGEHFFG